MKHGGQNQRKIKSTALDHLPFGSIQVPCSAMPSHSLLFIAGVNCSDSPYINILGPCEQANTVGRYLSG